MKEKKLNPTATKVIDFLTAHKGEEFTLEEISTAINVPRKSSGAITALRQSDKNPSGLIVHGQDKVKIVTAKRKVHTYKID